MPEFNPLHTLFARRLERQLAEAKNTANSIVEATIDELYRDALDIHSPVANSYNLLNNPAADKGQKARAEQEIIAHIANKKAEATEKHLQALDKVALGLPGNSTIAGNPFLQYWNLRGLKYQPDANFWVELGSPSNSGIRHHYELLEAIKHHFVCLQKEGTSTGEELEQQYMAERARYYAWLEEQHLANGQAAPSKKDADHLAFELGYEKRRLENDIANKKREQTLLPISLRIAKIFAFAQAIFVAGGTFMLISAMAAVVGLPGVAATILAGIVCPILFLAVARSNWLTINKEMGPLLNELFFDPALAHLPLWKRCLMWVRRSEFSLKAASDTTKGFTNIVAGSFLGVLTLIGGMSMLGIIPGLPMIGGISLGVFGTASLAVVATLMVLSLVTTFVYFLINNINQQDKNAGGKNAENDLARHEKLRTIANTSKLSLLKQYAVNIVIGMTGVTCTLAAASTDLFKSLATFLTGTTFMAIPLAGLVTALIACVAIYGIYPFYQSRTRGSTERLIAQDKGLIFDRLKGTAFDNMDVTGECVPDFRQLCHEQHKSFFHRALSFLMTPLFNMTRDDSERARFVNAAGQGMPAFMGAWTILTLGFTFVGVPSAILVAIPCALLFGTMAASFASYSANSAGLRKVKDSVTELNVLNADLAALNSAEIQPQYTHLYELGADKANAELYKSSRARQGSFYGLKTLTTFNRDAKIDGAERLIENIDDFMRQPDQTVNEPIAYLYRSNNGLTRRENPLAQQGSELGAIADSAGRHMTTRAGA